METKIRVLIADPNEDLRLLLSDVLGQEEDMEVAGCAMDGMEALSLTTELDPDVVLLELVMPKLDGLGVLRKLPDTERTPAVLVLTGFVNSHVVAESAELGACYFIPKPCDTPELLQRIRQFAPSRQPRPALVSRPSLSSRGRNPPWNRWSPISSMKSACPPTSRDTSIFGRPLSSPSGTWT